MVRMVEFFAGMGLVRAGLESLGVETVFAHSRYRSDQSEAFPISLGQAVSFVWEVRFDELAGALRAARGGSFRQALVKVGLGEVAVRWMSVLVSKGLSTLNRTLLAKFRLCLP